MLVRAIGRYATPDVSLRPTPIEGEAMVNNGIGHQAVIAEASELYKREWIVQQGIRSALSSSIQNCLSLLCPPKANPR